MDSILFVRVSSFRKQKVFCSKGTLSKRRHVAVLDPFDPMGTLFFKNPPGDGETSRRDMEEKLRVLKNRCIAFKLGRAALYQR